MKIKYDISKLSDGPHGGLLIHVQFFENHFNELSEREDVINADHGYINSIRDLLSHMKSYENDSIAYGYMSKLLQYYAMKLIEECEASNVMVDD